MAGFNTGVAYSKLFNVVDPKVLEPKKEDLQGRKMFKVNTLADPWALTYEWSWKEIMGQSSGYADRATDITVTDVSYHNEIGYIAERTAAFEYSQADLERANTGGRNIDIVTDRAVATHDALANWEDALIFNGNGDDRHPIYGLTTDATKAGYQTIDDPSVTLQKVVDPTNENAFSDAYKIVNYFMDAAAKITMLPGYHNVKPYLALAPKEYDLLTRPLVNQYNPDKTLWNMIQRGGNNGENVFAGIRPITELEAQYWNDKTGKDGKKDMAIVYLDTPDVAQIQVAMEPRRYGQAVASADNGLSYKQMYIERTGGLSVKFPAGIVQLTGLNDGSEKWAKSKADAKAERAKKSN